MLIYLPYFLQVLEIEIFKFEEQICDFEEELGASDNTGDESKKIPEEVRDSILAAIGKAKLLISQKLQQFRGLCDKNIVSLAQKQHCCIDLLFSRISFSFAAYKPGRRPLRAYQRGFGRFLGHGLHSG